MDFASLAASAVAARKRASTKRLAAGNAAEAKKSKIARGQDDARSNGCLEVLFEAKVFAGGQRMAPAMTQEKLDAQPSDWTLPFVVGRLKRCWVRSCQMTSSRRKQNKPPRLSLSQKSDATQARGRATSLLWTSH